MQDPVHVLSYPYQVSAFFYLNSSYNEKQALFGLELTDLEPLSG